MGHKLCVTSFAEKLEVLSFLSVRIENMQLTENILLHCSSLGELLLREGEQRFYPTLSFALNAIIFAVLLLSTEYGNEKTL